MSEIYFVKTKGLNSTQYVKTQEPLKGSYVLLPLGNELYAAQILGRENDPAFLESRGISLYLPVKKLLSQEEYDDFPALDEVDVFNGFWMLAQAGFDANLHPQTQRLRLRLLDYEHKECKVQPWVLAEELMQCDPIAYFPSAVWNFCMRSLQTRYKQCEETELLDHIVELYFSPRFSNGVDETALKWAQLAADKGSLRAQSIVAACFYFGVVKKSSRKAYSYAIKPALVQEPLGTYILACLYIEGKAVSKDEAFGVQLLKNIMRSADGLSSPSLYLCGMKLGECAKEGIGMEQNNVLSMRYYLNAQKILEEESEKIWNNSYITNQHQTKRALKLLKEQMSIDEIALAKSQSYCETC
jgi:TPR repeat protein